MPSLWFIVPVYGREPLADVCLRQLRRTCDELERNGIEATAVVIGHKKREPLPLELGFGFIERGNEFVSRKFNDGFQLACDPELNPRPADYVVPFGSDDWVDHRILLPLPSHRQVVAFQNVTVVRPDGGEITARYIDTEGGPGIRIYPRQVMAEMGYRPADEDRNKGCDTSIFVNLRNHGGFSLKYRQIDPRQIVDWKSDVPQITPYAKFIGRRVIQKWDDPFASLSDLYPCEALAEMQELYA